MKRIILTGILALAAGASGLMAQPAQPKGQPKGPTLKSKEEGAALQAMQAALGNPDATIKACEELITKFADTDFKDTALFFEADAYQQKNDLDKAQIFAERVLEINPKYFQAHLMLAEILAQRTREMDLDREEKLVKADKYADDAINLLKTLPKPNPQITDEQWEEGKKSAVARAHNAKGLAALTRKKFDVAAAEFKAAVENDPQPAFLVRQASALQSAGKNDEAIAICDKVLADAQVHPQIKQVAQAIRAQSAKATGKK
jgi:tetratricopeptide (TPR) repeat protein